MLDDIIMDTFINKADNEGKFGDEFLLFQNKAQEYICIQRFTSRFFMEKKNQDTKNMFCSHHYEEEKGQYFHHH